MNAVTPDRLRIVGQNMRSTTVSPWDFPMLCVYEFYPAEAEVRGLTDFAHPGTPANVQLLSCTVGQVNIYEMLSNTQVERIEEVILEQVEN